MAGELQNWAGEAGVGLHAVAVERASLMGLKEQIHYPIRRSFKKLKLGNPSISDEILLDVPCKAYHDSAEINGPVSTLLAFSLILRLPVRTDCDESDTNSKGHKCAQLQ